MGHIDVLIISIPPALKILMHREAVLEADSCVSLSGRPCSNLDIVPETIPLQ